MVKTVAFLFPGQGSQSVGMGKSYLALSKTAQAFFEQADHLLNIPLTKTMFEGPEDALRQTMMAQPALFLTSAAALAVLSERGISANFSAGHSLGEYSALYAAGAISFEDGLKLVYERGKAMAEAGETNPGAMGAILGLDASKIDAICKKVSINNEVCCPANFNSDTQIVVSGSTGAVKEALNLAKEAGALKVVPLNVSGAFHSPLMNSTVEKMRPFIEKLPISPSRFPVLTNVDAEPTSDPIQFRKKLTEQINHPVRWNETMKKLIQLGVDVFMEVGAGNVLSNLMKRLDRKKLTFYTDQLSEIDKNLSLFLTPTV